MLAVGGEKKGADIAAGVWKWSAGADSRYRKEGMLTLGNCLQKCGKDKREVIPRIEAMPERAGHEGGQAGSEARSLSFRRHSEIHVIP